MARTETFTSLLDRCESNVQTHVILSQLKILRKLDKQRLANERGSAIPTLIMTLVMLVIWVHVATVLAKVLGSALPFGH